MTRGRCPQQLPSGWTGRSPARICRKSIAMPTAIQGKADREVEVVIVGAGPVGLTLANYLGIYGVSTLVIEQLPELIDYPRAIGLDDEALRTLQTVGVADLIAPHTTPLHWMRFLTAKGRCWATIEPRSDEFGWSRRNAFIQPQADRILYESLGRFPPCRGDVRCETERLRPGCLGCIGGNRERYGHPCRLHGRLRRWP